MVAFLRSVTSNTVYTFFVKANIYLLSTLNGVEIFKAELIEINYNIGCIAIGVYNFCIKIWIQVRHKLRNNSPFRSLLYTCHIDHLQHI
jgi:hypothetical protein